MLNKSTSKGTVLSNALPVLEIFKHSLHKPLRLADIEKMTELSHQTVFRKVKILESNGVLIKVGNYYKPNFENTLVFKILELVSAEEREEIFARYSQLKEPFAQLINFAAKTPEIIYIVLFGSYSIGRATKNSDVDIFIAVDESGVKKTKGKTERLLRQLEGGYFLRNYGFAPIFATLKDVKEMVDERKKFIQSIFEDGVIVYGEESYFKSMISLLKEWSAWK